MHLSGSPLLDVGLHRGRLPVRRRLPHPGRAKPAVPLLLDSYTHGRVHHRPPGPGRRRPDLPLRQRLARRGGLEPDSCRSAARTRRATAARTGACETSGPAGGPVRRQRPVHLRPLAELATAACSSRPSGPTCPPAAVSVLADGRVAADADLARDILITGPIECDVHIENPTPLRSAAALLLPGRAPRAGAGLRRAWPPRATTSRGSYTKYLLAGGWDYPRAITFNTNTIDNNRLGVDGGAKDDVDQAEFFRQLAVAEDLGHRDLHPRRRMAAELRGLGARPLTVPGRLRADRRGAASSGTWTWACG